MPSWKKVIVSGSDASLNSLNVATNVVAQSFTGSLFGTASFAVSSSHAIFADTSSQATSASFATTSSYSFVAVSASHANTSSYAIYAQTASYATNITVSGSISNVDYIDFDTNVAFTNVPGRLGWDSGENTLQLGLSGGNVTYSVGEQILQYCFNAETSSLSKGQVVYISGSQGNKIAVRLADDSGDPTSAGTLGFVAETITAGGNGWIITEGNLRKLNTIGLTPGALLYLGSTPGTYTETKPIAPRHAVRLGYVERVHASVGSIYVKIDNGYEIGELHDIVDSTTTASYGDLLIKSGSVWINSKQLTGSYGLTGSLTADQIYATSLTASNLQVVNHITASSIAATSASFGYVQSVTGSAVIIGQEYIVLNTQTPAARYAGLQIYDSGSNATASIVWDSQTNHFVYENASGSVYAGGGFLAGPKNTGSLADITYPTQYRVLRSQGDDHVYDSNIIDNDTAVSILINTQVTGSLGVTGGITGSLLGTASYATQALSSSYATTASYADFASTSSNVQGGTQYYVPLWNTNTSLTSSYLHQSGSILKTIYNGTDRGLTLDYNFDSFILGNPGVGNSTYLQVFDGGSTINVYSPNYTYFNDKVGVRIIPTNPGLAVSGSLEITGPGTSKFMNSDVQITGSLNVTGGITGSLLGTASFADQATSSSYALNATSASHALNADNAISASYALSSSYAVTASHAPSSVSSSYAISASYAANADLLDGKDSTIFATTGSNIFLGQQTIRGNIFLSGSSFPLVYTNEPTHNMLFGMFDGISIYGPYLQIFGNQYPTLQQRGGAEIVYDIRNNADANFHVSSYNGSSWTQKFLVNDIGAQVTGSLEVTGGITGSLLGTASYADQALSSSYAVTASYVEIFPYTGSAKITGSLDVTGSIESTTVRSNIFINNQTINTPIFVPSGSNALIVGPVGISGSVTVETGSNLYITDFSNPTPNLQAVTDVGSTTTNSITAANFITTSDRRLKSDIKQIENPFEILGGIKSYEYIKDGKKDAGFIAQEVQETIPYAVFENEEGMLTMSDRPLLAYLYAAVMELKEENKQLRERLGAINNKL